MLTFQRFVNDTAAKGGSINVMFEERLLALVGALERIAKVLAAAEIPFELIGGAAVMVHVNRVEPSAVRLTEDIDILINRADLDRIKETAAGFALRHAVRLIFTGEKVRPNQAAPNPPLRPQHLSVHGVDVAAAPVADLILMKLSNNRDIDRFTFGIWIPLDW